MPSVVLWESGPQLEARQGGIIPPLNDIAACKNRQQNIDQNEEILGVITLLLCLMYRKETQTTTVFQEQNMLRRISMIFCPFVVCMQYLKIVGWLQLYKKEDISDFRGFKMDVGVSLYYCNHHLVFIVYSPEI